MQREKLLAKNVSQEEQLTVLQQTLTELAKQNQGLSERLSQKQWEFKAEPI